LGITARDVGRFDDAIGIVKLSVGIGPAALIPINKGEEAADRNDDKTAKPEQCLWSIRQQIHRWTLWGFSYAHVMAPASNRQQRD
jgi:hypothetical protein